MGDIFGNGGILSGGGSSKQSTSNQAFPYLKGALSGTVGQGAQAGTQMSNMLGLNGAPAQNQGFQNWQNSTGYQFGKDQGMQSITGNAATQGLLNSGSTLKAMNTYGQNYADSKYGDYMSQLQGLLGSGNQSAGIIGSSGNTSQSTQSPSSGGLGGMLGSLLAK